MRNHQFSAVLARIYLAPHIDKYGGTVLFWIFAVLTVVFAFMEPKE